jgi:serine/threonine-protein kinase
MRDTLPEGRLLDLLARWDEARKEGQELDIEQLAGDTPQLVEELRRRIAQLRGLDPFEPSSTDPGPSAVGRGQAPRQVTDQTLGRYDVLGEIASGGMGVVLRAYDRQLHREVALKLMHREREADPAMRLRFVEEAQLTGQLQHPGVPPVFERGELDDGRPYYTMKVVKGRTLGELLAPDPQDDESERAAGHRPDPARLLSIFEAICQAVAYAHGKGIIHRDLKPSNVMVGAFGEVQVMDWGLAKVLGAVRNDEVAGSVVRTVRTESSDSPVYTGTVGTPAYMPLEQAQGLTDHVDTRADVFALGAILCKILTGAPAYTGRTPDEVLRKALRGDLADAYARLGDCGADAELITLTRQCLAAEPLDRPEDAGAVAARVGDYQDSVARRLKEQELARAAAEARAGEATKRAAVERSRRRRTVALAAATVGLIALAVGGWVYLARQRAARQLATSRAVDEALARADLARGRAQGLDDPAAEVAAWKEGLVHAQRADDALRGGEPSPGERARVDATLAGLAHSLEGALLREREAETEQRLVARLEEVRGLRAEHMDPSRTDREYATAFREAGLDPDAADPEEAAAWIAGRRYADEIIAALDDMTAIRRWHLKKGPDDTSWQRPHAIATKSDRDPWRAEVRACFGLPREEVGDFLKAKAADRENLARSHLTSLLLLTALLRGSGDKEAGREVLDVAWAKGRGDFWVNFEMSTTYWDPRDLRYTSPSEACRFLTAAVAIRPRSHAALNNLGNALRELGRFDAAIAAFEEAIRLKPDLAEAHSNLASVLSARGDYDQALLALRRSLEIDPKNPVALANLGDVLRSLGRPHEAIDACRESIKVDPNYYGARVNLGDALVDVGRPDEAAAEFQTALALKPDDHHAHTGLGMAWDALGRLDDAAAEYRRAIELQPDYHFAHSNLGNVLNEQGKHDEAIVECRRAIELDPGQHLAHVNLGNAFLALGRPDEAIAEYREAIRLRPQHGLAHFDLGLALRQKGETDQAMAEYREAILLAPESPEAYCNLGLMLGGQGHYDEAVEVLRKAHELGRRRPNWRHPTAEWLARAERMAALAGRLPRIPQGEEPVRDGAERLLVAKICQDTGRHAAAARFFGEVLDADPALAADLRAGHRYNAACSAALAGCGQGKDDPPPDADARARLRARALDWLKADLDSWEHIAASAEGPARVSIIGMLNHWMDDADLAGVRNDGALGRLPREEQETWRALWARVAALRERLTK